MLFTIKVSFTAVTVALRTNQSARSVMTGDLPMFSATWVALAPLAWIMAQIYGLPGVGWWATLFFTLPVYIMRVALRQIIEMREMFTQTIGALAQAVDARDTFTSGHSERVQLISVDIGRVMRLKDAEIEALEWGGLLHDIGKIGVPDSVLLKQDKLTRDKRALMNRHPVIGANIIAHVGKLAPELPIIRHHHEWYNGSGYPARLMGDEIPKLARVLHVGDAFEAMTSARPYRMRPLSREQAIGELRKYAGVQFDPLIVDAFLHTAWAKDAAGAGRPTEVRPVPLLAQAAARMVPPPAPDGSRADASCPRSGVLIAGLLIGLIAGFAAGGRLDNLIAIRLRWPLVIFGALALRLGTEAALTRDVGIVDSLRVPLLAAAYGILAVGLWANRARPGMSLALVGIALNATAILVNGGFMPVWEPSLTAAGFGRADVFSPIQIILPATLDANFFRSAGPLGDVIPVPLPWLRNVLSIGDVILGAGLAFFLFAGLVRRPEETWPDGRPIHRPEPSQPVILAGSAARDLPGGVRAGTGLTASLAGVATLERPVVLAGSGAGLASPTPAPSGGVTAPALPGVFRGVAVRARHHPYVLLAGNGSLSALWTGQLISLLGDRVHQVALAALVYGTTNSAIAGALTFVAATLPNLLFGPIAGVLVDRWDQKRVLIVSDLLRAGIVLLIPAGVSVNVVLAYPLVFLLTTVSIFFRPARTAVTPRVVREDELVTANSVTWLSETLADVLGYPFAGLFVAFLGSALPLAFWLDSVSYVASALLVVTVVIPPVVRSVGSVAPVPGLAGIRDDLVAGWRFLRGEPILLANTLQAGAGQLTIGATIALTPLYAKVVLRLDSLSWKAAYAFMETGIGVGNLVGGFVIGLLGARIAKGRMVIGGYAAYGLAVAALGLTDNLSLALGLAFAMGVSNMVFIIPTQTLFQERTPGDMMGRVLGFRFSAVFGAMTFAMAASGVLGDAVGVGPVLVVFGVITVAAGLAGLASRPLREA